MLAVLRRRDFTLLWIAGLVSVAGDWVLMTALPYVVYVSTGSTLATAGMVVAELVPAAVLSSPAGVLVDRWDRRRILVASNLAQAVVVTALLVVGDATLWVVYVVAALQSCAAAPAGPAESALLPSLVPEELLVPANALNVLNNRLGRLLGVPVGAALLSWSGLGVVVLVDVATFLVAAALVAGVRRPAAPGGPAPDADQPWRFWEEWGAGWRVVAQDRTIAVLFVVLGLMTFAGTMLDPLFVPWVRDVLDQGVGAVAVLTTVASASGMVGSVLVGWLGARMSPRDLMAWGSVGAGALLLVKFHVPALWLAVALGVPGGVLAVASSVGVETLAQRRTPEPVRGRVFGSLQGVIWLMSLLGALLGGVMGELVGIVPALTAAAVLVVLSGVAVLRLVPATDGARPT